MSADVQRAVAGIAAMVTFATSFVVAGAVGWRVDAVAAPNTGYCERVNGNTDGSPCIDQDPRTGRWSANDSADYRDRTK